jgi:hypothetical protein
MKLGIQGTVAAVNTSTYIILVKNLKGRDHLRGISVGGVNILKIILQKQDVRMWIKFEWKLQPSSSKCGSPGTEATFFRMYTNLKKTAYIKPNTAVGKTVVHEDFRIFRFIPA